MIAHFDINSGHGGAAPAILNGKSDKVKKDLTAGLQNSVNYIGSVLEDTVKSNKKHIGKNPSSLRAKTQAMHQSLYGRRPMKDGKTIGRNYEQRQESFGKINGRILATGVPIVRGHENSTVTYPSNGNINNYSLQDLGSFLTDMEQRVRQYHQAHPKDKVILADYRQLGDYFQDLQNPSIHKLDAVQDRDLVSMIQKALDNQDPVRGTFTQEEIRKITDRMKEKGYQQAVIGLTSVSDKDDELVPTVLRFYADEDEPAVEPIIVTDTVEVPAPESPSRVSLDDLSQTDNGIYAGGFRDYQHFSERGRFDANGFFGLAGLATKYGKDHGINLLINGQAEVRLADYTTTVNDKEVGHRATRFIEGKIGGGVQAKRFRLEAGLTAMDGDEDFDYNGLVKREIKSSEFGQYVELAYLLGDGTKIALNLQKNDGKTDVLAKGKTIASQEIETNSWELYGTHYFGDIKVTPSVKKTWSQDKEGKNLEDVRVDFGLEALFNNVIWNDVQLLLGGDYFYIKDHDRRGYTIKAGVGFGF
ncbi:MAG: hypothetical protein GXP63_02555 [DPANN group archaeon]|nr:hypothetical protein [DPANN group archaeon]